MFNPFVPGMQNINIRQFIISSLLIIGFVKSLSWLKASSLDAHYSERQGLMG